MKNSNRTVCAIATGFAALMLAACGPVGVQDAGHQAPTISTVTATATAEASDSPSPSHSSPSSPPPPSTQASTPPSTSPASAPVTTAAKHAKPAVTHTTAPRVHRTSAAPVHHKPAPTAHRTTPPAASSGCSIRSAAGNCYKAGQFCRKADRGRTTTDAHGRKISCVIQSGKPHWHY
ncbi:hypothetical protein [Streptomyces sp. NBC_01198]|uniref:hypothetical protein n=1 Tax=Streptomyces sp. NBC_01198 TaxID=2903769 RepID=UPI002E0D307D|nr:hypothetical protein OG702_20060 [Streptomyces sp. NBC_01198]